MKIEKGLTLKDNKFYLGYAVLISNKEEKYNFLTFYNQAFTTFFEGCFEWDDSITGLKERIKNGKLTPLNDRELKKARKIFDKTYRISDKLFCDEIRDIDLKETSKLHNILSFS
jgi:hypothetical protein